jgi:hypothetical protein
MCKYTNSAPHPTYLRRPGVVIYRCGVRRNNRMSYAHTHARARTHICTPPPPSPPPLPTMQAHARTARRTCAQTRGRARRARPPRLPCRSRGASAKHERSACNARHAADRTRPCDTRGLDGRCSMRVRAVCTGCRPRACGPHVCVCGRQCTGWFDGRLHTA